MVDGSSPMVEVQGLTKRYGAFEAVKGISFEVARGRVVGVLGPNGAGKSTTLRILAGFLGATEGSVRIGGHDIVEERAAAARCIGYMPETSPLYRDMRVEEYLLFRAELKGIGRKKRRAEVTRCTERARVDDVRKVLIGHLSKGYRQRVGLADALLGAPPLLILDEPSAGLDPNQIRDVRGLIAELSESHTILLSTHILPEVEATCSDVVVISRGRLVASGPLDALRREGGSDRLDLRVRGDGDRAQEVIEKLPSVADLERELRGETARFTLRIARDAIGSDEDPDDLGPASADLVGALVKAGLRIERVAPLATSLEAVFSRLTTEDEPEDAA